MALSTQPYKGARDFYPEDKRVQKYIFNRIRTVVERYGYQEYDAPLLEPLDLYQSKTSEEIVSEQTYAFEDRGGRQVVIRPEMTPSVSRMVAGRRQELAYPLRWYSIPNLWRYERPQAGRLREHWQLNVDLFGVPGFEGDHEIIIVADQILRAFGADQNMYEIRINSRKLLEKIMLEHNLNQEQRRVLARFLDAYTKFRSEKEQKEYVEKQLSEKEDPVEFFKLISSLTKPGGELESLNNSDEADELNFLEKALKSQGVNVKIDFFLTRGFDYYTDVVFEVYDTSEENPRSIFGGGRYDGLVAQFGVESIPTVGFGMGDVTLQKFLEGHNLISKLPVETNAVVILIGDVYTKVGKILDSLRMQGLNIAVDSTKRRIDSQIRSAIKSGVRFVIFIGEKEIEANQFTLRDLEKGEEKKLNLDHVASSLKAWRPDK